MEEPETGVTPNEDDDVPRNEVEMTRGITTEMKDKDKAEKTK